MRYADIYPFDISNGKGIRVSLFTQGCHIHCKGCFNQSLWDFNKGVPFTKDTIKYIIDLCKPDYISGLSILGGEPLSEENIPDLEILCKKFKQEFPNKTIWLWTGYTWEQLQKRKDLRLLSDLDVIVSGPFVQTQKDLSLAWRGSKNQRIHAKLHKLSANSNMFYDITVDTTDDFDNS